jgi:hypothetical protein
MSHQTPKRKRSPKPKWTFRPEKWAETLIEQETEKNPQLDRTAAIHALIQRTTDLEAKLKVAEADKEAQKSRALFLENFMKTHGIQTQKTQQPSKPKPEPTPLPETQETKGNKQPTPEKTQPLPTDPIKRQWTKVDCPRYKTVMMLQSCEATQKSRPDLCKEQNCPNINPEIITDLKTKTDPVELVQ